MAGKRSTRKPSTQRSPAAAGKAASQAAVPSATAAASIALAELSALGPGEVALHHDLTVIEVSDAADLTSLLADPRLANLVVARIGTTAAVVLPQSAPRLLLALIKAGHTPAVIGGP